MLVALELVTNIQNIPWPIFILFHIQKVPSYVWFVLYKGKLKERIEYEAFQTLLSGNLRIHMIKDVKIKLIYKIKAVRNWIFWCFGC